MSKEELLKIINDSSWDGKLSKELMEFVKKHFRTCKHFDGYDYSKQSEGFPQQIV